MGKAAAVIQPAHTGNGFNKHQRFFAEVGQTLVDHIQTLLIEIDVGLRAVSLPHHLA